MSEPSLTHLSHNLMNAPGGGLTYRTMIASTQQPPRHPAPPSFTFSSGHLSDQSSTLIYGVIVIATGLFFGVGTTVDKAITDDPHRHDNILLYTLGQVLLNVVIIVLPFYVIKRWNIQHNVYHNLVLAGLWVISLKGQTGLSLRIARIVHTLTMCEGEEDRESHLINAANATGLDEHIVRKRVEPFEGGRRGHMNTSPTFRKRQKKIPPSSATVWNHTQPEASTSPSSAHKSIQQQHMQRMDLAMPTNNDDARATPIKHLPILPAVY